MAYKNPRTIKGNQKQSGAALVEFAFVFIIFTALLFAIIEFAVAIFNWSRMVQATHAGARYAITGDPACDVFGYRDEGFIPNCDDGSSGITLSASCSAGDYVVREITSCPVGTDDSGCKIVERMQRYSPFILTGGSQVTVTYTCSTAGDPDLPRATTIVTVSADGVPYNFMTPGLLGFESSVEMPAFETTRVGEDLFTYTPPAP